MTTTTHYNPQDFVEAYYRARTLLRGPFGAPGRSPKELYDIFIAEGMEPSLALSAVVAARCTAKLDALHSK